MYVPNVWVEFAIETWIFEEALEGKILLINQWIKATINFLGSLNKSDRNE